MSISRTVASAAHRMVAVHFIAMAATLPSAAEEPAANHEGHGQIAAAPAQTTDGKPLREPSKALDDVMMKMHTDMAVPYTNDVDLDFIQGMNHILDEPDALWKSTIVC